MDVKAVIKLCEKGKLKTISSRLQKGDTILLVGESNFRQVIDVTKCRAIISLDNNNSSNRVVEKSISLYSECVVVRKGKKPFILCKKNIYSKSMEEKFKNDYKSKYEIMAKPIFRKIVRGK